MSCLAYTPRDAFDGKFTRARFPQAARGDRLHHVDKTFDGHLSCCCFVRDVGYARKGSGIRGDVNKYLQIAALKSTAYTVSILVAASRRA